MVDAAGIEMLDAAGVKGTATGVNGVIEDGAEPETVSHAVAARADDAKPEHHLWDDRLVALAGDTTDKKTFGKSVTVLRRWLLGRWMRNLFRSFRRDMVSRHGKRWMTCPPGRRTEHCLDLVAGRECLSRACESSWWEWSAGSRLFFWRWPTHFRSQARDGVPIRHLSAGPTYRVPQRVERDKDMAAAIKVKLQAVRDRGYIGPGPVRSLTSYFAVPKAQDIRMVYDATKSGLNDTLWAPSFPMPMVDSQLRAVDTTTWMGDNDLGEMFLNFMLDEKTQDLCGVDVTPYFEEETKGGIIWERWNRCLMGLKPSPHNAALSFGNAEELIRGDRRSETNPFRWDSIRLNLPGSATYNPMLPWVSKVRTADGALAADLFTYCDDLRLTGGSSSECWSAQQRVAGICSYLGIQDATRKHRPPSQTPGAWSGTLTRVTSGGVGVLVSQDKWDKTKRLIREVREQLAAGSTLNHKELQWTRGFLIYVSRTYPMMVPYLKGLHHTLDAWHGNRDEDGWRYSKRELKAIWDDLELDEDGQDEEPGEAAVPTVAPKEVTPVGRLADDLDCLEWLTRAETPPVRWVRCGSICVAYYGGGDASGAGFGSAMEGPEGVRIRHGLWGADAAGKSSNYRELRNLVEALEEEARQGTLEGAEIFMVTDNSTAESAYHRGTSSNRDLFDLVLRLRLLEMNCGVRIWVIHISGSRMIAVGIDGLSHGNLLEGVMAGQSISALVPLSETALARSPEIEGWVQTWMAAGNGIQVLTTEDWFDVGHGQGPGALNADGVWSPTEESGALGKLWAPAPAAASVAVEELRKARLKRPHIPHVFVCPRLLTPMWRKELHKVSDVVFELPAGVLTEWPLGSHEPLLIGVCLPFVLHRPWQLRRQPLLLELERKVRRVWKEKGGTVGPLLRELCQLPRWLDALPPGVVWRLLQGGSLGQVPHC